MQRHIRERLTYANVVATLALFIALGGASYAAIQLPPRSVGPKQLKPRAVKKGKLAPNAVTGPKVQNESLNGNDIRNGSILLRDIDSRARNLLTGPVGPVGAQGPPGPPGVAGPVTYVTEDGFVNCNEDPKTSECLAGLAGFARASAVARCPDGQQPLGGGFHLLGVTGFDEPGAVIGEVVSSEPFADGGAAGPNSWRVLYDTNSLTFEQFRAWAACIPVTS